MADPADGARAADDGREAEEVREAAGAAGSGLGEGEATVVGDPPQGLPPAAAEAVEKATESGGQGGGPTALEAYAQLRAGRQLARDAEEARQARLAAEGNPPKDDPPHDDVPTPSRGDQDAVEETYGEWVSGTKENPGNLKENLWRSGMVVEAIVRDYEGKDQGSVILYVITEA